MNERERERGTEDIASQDWRKADWSGHEEDTNYRRGRRKSVPYVNERERERGTEDIASQDWRKADWSGHEEDTNYRRIVWERQEKECTVRE